MSVERATQLKAERTQAKTRVTTTAKRLIGAIERKSDLNCLEKFMIDLEESMANFDAINEVYCSLVENDGNLETFITVNNQNLKEYEESVTEVYSSAMEEFCRFKRSHLQSQKAVKSGSLLLRLECCKDRIQALSDKTMAGVNEGKVSSLETFNGLCLQFDPLIKEMLDLSAQLSESQDAEGFEKTNHDIKCILSKVDSLKLDGSMALLEPSSRPPSRITAHETLTSASFESKNKSDNLMGSNSFQQRRDFGSFGQFSSSSNSQEPGGIQIKKVSLPEFSGLRKDWPEFKAIWRELAECTLRSRFALAYELKRSLKGEAANKVKNIYVTKPEAYDTMWTRLSEYYDDVSAGVHTALGSLKKLRQVKQDDFKGLVHLVDEVEGVYAQLEELGQVDVVTAREIDAICDLLPTNTKMMWARLYHKLGVVEKVKPFATFLNFITTERASVARLAESQKSQNSRQTDSNLSHGKSSQKQFNKVNCVLHKGDVKHKTAECKDFRALSLDAKYQALREVHACFRCFGLHRRDSCKSKVQCENCQNSSHHSLMCKKVQNHAYAAPVNTDTQPLKQVSSSTHVVRDSGLSLYAVQPAFVVNGGKTANIFCDNGSNSSYITHRAAERLKAKRLEKYTLDVTTMGNVSHEYDTMLYEVSIRTIQGEIVPVLAFGIAQITGPVSRLDLECLSKIFPERDVSLLQRRSSQVDMLLGCDYYSLHPKREICTRGNLSIMQGELGICLVGSHPDVQEGTEINSNMVRVVHDQWIKTDVNFVFRKQLTQPDLNVVSPMNRVNDVNFLSRKSLRDVSTFIEGENLATGADPKCGGCKCGKCPSVGHTYSFREEQELKLIQDNLKYSEAETCWYTSYPWLVDPCQLPDNYQVALATLGSTERTLFKEPQWALKYREQIDDMLQRGVARKLTAEELDSWEGPKFYISHLAVCNPKSQTTPVRIVFNSSQKSDGMSLNGVLAKGPDGYMNNLLGLLLRWRENPVAVVGDIRKMFHSVKLNPIEQHCHRFLWRDLDVTRKPDVYIMLRVNMGDTPAPAICTEALYKTAKKFADDCPRAAQLIVKSTYVDDVIDSFVSKDEASHIVQMAEQILSKGGFEIKCWLFSGESETDSQLKGSENVTRILGVDWDSKRDLIVFQAVLNFSPKKRGERVGPNLTLEEIPRAIPSSLTRRLVLEQVMSIFDPLGLLSPFTFIAKLNLRETWANKLGWDDPLPPDLYRKWSCFFQKLFQVNELEYDRTLRPENAEGKPWLVIFSDASDLAYGFVGYVRWKLSGGGYWVRLIMAKCRIAPLRKLSTPQMELNAAVLSARARKIIQREMRFDFERILHLVDSETVLNMVNKTSTRFKVFEGVRIGEIQASTQGDMSDWAWLPGSKNTADWLTRGKVPCELGPESEWWLGPSILYKELSEWGLKFGLQREIVLPGEKKLVGVSYAHSSADRGLGLDWVRFGSVRKVFWIIARILAIAESKSFSGGHTSRVTPQLLKKAENLVVKEVQGSCDAFGDAKGRFKALTPVLDSSGVWVVGKRLGNKSPMTPDGSRQVLLPADHVVTRMLMREAHVSGCHRGRDATLARFRSRYWTPHGSKIASSVKNACQLCKLREAQFLGQEMSELPKSRLQPAPAFTFVMIDLFGPFKISGEVQKRTTGKGYGVVFTDLTMRAVHLEGVFGYDTDSFMLAFSRFVSVRGWPEKVYSDPGSQLVGAEKELREAWSNLDRTHLVRKGAENGLTWIFGPADAPWYQGAVEALVKSAKRAFTFAFHGKRFSAAQFLSACYEVSNILNERPIGVLPSVDSEISILTPNCLLMGRATAQNPGGWQPNSRLLDQFNVVQEISDLFWKKWCELCAPALVIQKKWHTAIRDLKPGDVVLMADKDSFRGQHRIALVKKTFPGKDGKVRHVTLTYKNYRVGEKVTNYAGGTDCEVNRSVHKLALLIPCDEKYD